MTEGVLSSSDIKRKLRNTQTDITMYLAPLNYNRFFKKVFSDISIAKQFLEDFLDKTIEEITALDTKHKVTDDASIVEFDFRCKISGQYVIIDMQQWYKTDIIKRFYVYHAASTVLQLETMLTKSLKVTAEAKYDTKNYDELLPVLTLIWMADDTLQYEEDFVAFSLTPEQVVEFVQNQALWQEGDLKKLTASRQKVLTLLGNRSKNIQFLGQNRLVYIFQKNIVKNKKYSKYFDWFELAEKTKNRNNTKEEFEQYEKNEAFMSLIQRIRKDSLESTDFTYIDNYEQFMKQSKIHDAIVAREAREIALEEGIQIGEMRGEIKGEIKGKIKAVIAAHEQGLTIELIALIVDLPIEEVKSIIDEYQKELKTN